MVEFLGELGFDFVWIDLEHGGGSAHDTRHLEDLARAAAAGGTEILLRVTRADSSMINSVLDAGIRNLLVPQVRMASEVEDSIRASRFEYQGEPGGRGLGSVRANSWGRASAEWAQEEDLSTFVGVMIENRAAIENLDRILYVLGLGFAYIGPSDLSVSYGCTKQTEDVRVTDAVRKIEEQARLASVPVGKGVNSLEAGIEALKAGYQILRIGGDLAAIRASLGSWLNDLREVQASLH